MLLLSSNPTFKSLNKMFKKVPGVVLICLVLWVLWGGFAPPNQRPPVPSGPSLGGGGFAPLPDPPHPGRKISENPSNEFQTCVQMRNDLVAPKTLYVFVELLIPIPSEFHLHQIYLQ